MELCKLGKAIRPSNLTPYSGQESKIKHPRVIKWYVGKFLGEGMLPQERSEKRGHGPELPSSGWRRGPGGTLLKFFGSKCAGRTTVVNVTLQ